MENWFSKRRTRFQGRMTKGRESRDNADMDVSMKRAEGVSVKDRIGFETGWLDDLFQLHLIDPFQ